MRDSIIGICYPLVEERSITDTDAFRNLFGFRLLDKVEYQNNLSPDSMLVLSGFTFLQPPLLVKKTTVNHALLNTVLC